MKSAMRDILWTILFAAIAFILLRVSVQTFRVEMPSMQPSIQPGVWVVVDKVGYRFGSLQRGDIIVFKAPEDAGRDFIKRIIAIPDDTVEVKNQKVYVNGVALNEPYLTNPPHYTSPLQKIPSGEYFVLGDNRDISVDSHLGWLVPESNIIGRAWLIIWPSSQWGRAPHYPLLADGGSVDLSVGANEQGLLLPTR